ncbi:MAG: radical SAM family heme chaperone HemW [Butyrivibrio sp.]|nr:radical SAM family heme chaperone HemW [Butyrivibrio sp.]
MKDLSIYLHIPFCVRKCKYCDFLSYAAEESEREGYVELLTMEIEKQSLFYKDFQVVSIFVGGGTPSILEGRSIERLLNTVKSRFNIAKNPEITVEVNPDTVTGDKLTAYLNAGVNRLSIGLQSADDEELKTLGRIHDYRTFLNAYELARKLGFKNINVDLISAISGQSCESYRKTLEKIIALEPEHISAYSLIVEEGTWFYEHRGELAFPTEEEDRQMYELTAKMLSDNGYHRYEISNYAKEGFECIHNKRYWTRGSYAGFGLGAASLVDEVRWSNKRVMKDYAAAVMSQDTSSRDLYDAVMGPTGDLGDAYTSHAGDTNLNEARTRFGEDIQYLTQTEQMEEFMFLGLRLTAGVDRAEFKKKFGVPIEDIYGKTLEKMQKDKLLTVDGHIRLTPYGTDISNYVMSEFIL